MAYTAGEAEYPIAAVSKLTGVSCPARRVWERRYGFPVPHRSASGHRRYRLDQVAVLRQLSELSRSGRSISALIADVQAGRLTIDSAVPARAPTGDALPAELDAFLERLLCGDIASADTRFDNLEASLGAEDLVTRVIAPVLTETGERWFRRRCAVFQERCVSGFLRHRLASIIEEARRANSAPRHTIVIGAVQGDRHEGGVLIANLILERAGWRVINLGVDLPVSEYVRAVEHLRPDALALSFVLSRNINKRFQELSRLESLPVFVGGRSILNYQSLARRYGLTPVLGPVTVAVQSLLGEFEAWSRHRTPPTV